MACPAVPDTPPPPAQAPASQAPSWQARLFDVAISELVCQHRESFAPLWTVESWAKLLIWLALRSGCATDQASLEGFAAGLGPDLSRRLRRLFFARDLEDLNLRLMADPAEGQVLAVPIDARVPGPDAPRVWEGLGRVGLADRVAPRETWQLHDALMVVPWKGEGPSCS
ncbi:MAG: protein phosphatase [Cyanobium sp.]